LLLDLKTQAEVWIFKSDCKSGWKNDYMARAARHIIHFPLVEPAEKKLYLEN